MTVGGEAAVAAAVTVVTVAAGINSVKKDEMKMMRSPHIHVVVQANSTSSLLSQCFWFLTCPDLAAYLSRVRSNRPRQSRDPGRVKGQGHGSDLWVPD